MTKDKIVKFASILPRMDPVVAKEAIDQFPHASAEDSDTFEGDFTDTD